MNSEKTLGLSLASVALLGLLVQQVLLGDPGDQQAAKDSKTAQLYVRLLGTSA